MANTEKQTDMASVVAALIEGDRYLDVDSARILLGNLAPATFRQYAAKPGFPRAVKLGKGRKWRRRELLEWADRERDRQNRAA